MIFQLLFTIIFGLLGVLLFFLPGYGQVPLLLPWGIDPIVQKMAMYFNGAIVTLPYLQVVLQVLGIGLGFELALLVIRLFLGSRSIGNNTN